jgi:hypothetical protein
MMKFVTFLLENLTTNVLLALICYLGGFYSFLPLYFEPISYLEETTLRKALESGCVGYKYSSVATLALSVPLLFDCIADSMTNAKRGKHYTGDGGFLNNLEKVLFLIGLIICPITAFFDNTTNWAFIYVSCNWCQLNFVAGAIMISLNRYDGKCWTDRATYIGVISLSLATAMAGYHDDAPHYGRTELDLASYGLAYISAIIFLVCAARWFYKILISQEAKKTNEKCNYFPLIYVTMSVVCVLTLAVLSLCYKRLDLYDQTALLVNNLIYTMYALFNIFISMRMVKSEVIQGLVS